MSEGYIQRLVGDVRILVLGPRMLDDAEFDAQLAQAVGMASSVRVAIVVILGAPAMSVERRAKLDRAGVVRIPTAVLTDSKAMRAILTALSWLGGNVRPFSADGEMQACEFLQVPVASRQRVVDAVRSMTSELMGSEWPRDGAAESGQLLQSVERIKQAVGERAEKMRRNATK